jgi:hypothetical protein
MNEMRSGPAAGWYADPAGSGGRRYWDGVAWGAETVVAPPGIAERPEDTPRCADEPWALGAPVDYVATPAYSALLPADARPVAPDDEGPFAPADERRLPRAGARSLDSGVGRVTTTEKRRWPLWVAIGVGALGLLALIGAATGEDEPSAASNAITATSPPRPTIVPATTAVPDVDAGRAPAAAPPTTAPPLGTRANPIPLGQAGVVNDADEGDITITVNSADLEGNAAVAATNKFNPPSSTGRYVVVNLTATYAGGQQEQTASLIGAVSFSVSSHAGTGHRPTFVVAPDPQLDELADLLPGGTTTGNEAFEYEPGSAPLLRVEESSCSGNCDVLWFDLA